MDSGNLNPGIPTYPPVPFFAQSRSTSSAWRTQTAGPVSSLLEKAGTEQAGVAGAGKAAGVALGAEAEAEEQFGVAAVTNHPRTTETVRLACPNLSRRLPN